MPPRSKTKPQEVVKIKETFSVKREPNTPPHTPPDSEVYEVVEEGWDDPLSASTPNNDLVRRISAGSAALKVRLKTQYIFGIKIINIQGDTLG